MFCDSSAVAGRNLHASPRVPHLDQDVEAVERRLELIMEGYLVVSGATGDLQPDHRPARDLAAQVRLGTVGERGRDASDGQAVGQQQVETQVEGVSGWR